ncbi:MAG: hypothetical protein AB7S26_10100 [Sandaracinaceae bacterium]
MPVPLPLPADPCPRMLVRRVYVDVHEYVHVHEDVHEDVLATRNVGEVAKTTKAACDDRTRPCQVE